MPGRRDASWPDPWSDAQEGEHCLLLPPTQHISVCLQKELPPAVVQLATVRHRFMGQQSSKGKRPITMETIPPIVLSLAPPYSSRVCASKQLLTAFPGVDHPG